MVKLRMPTKAFRVLVPISKTKKRPSKWHLLLSLEPIESHLIPDKPPVTYFMSGCGLLYPTIQKNGTYIVTDKISEIEVQLEDVAAIERDICVGDICSKCWPFGYKNHEAK
jgi:hypothetical protein